MSLNVDFVCVCLASATDNYEPNYVFDMCMGVAWFEEFWKKCCLFHLTCSCRHVDLCILTFTWDLWWKGLWISLTNYCILTWTSHELCWEGQKSVMTEFWLNLHFVRSRKNILFFTIKKCHTLKNQGKKSSLCSFTALIRFQVCLH